MSCTNSAAAGAATSEREDHGQCEQPRHRPTLSDPAAERNPPSTLGLHERARIAHHYGEVVASCPSRPRAAPAQRRPGRLSAGLIRGRAVEVWDSGYRDSARHEAAGDPQHERSLEMLRGPAPSGHGGPLRRARANDNRTESSSTRLPPIRNEVRHRVAGSAEVPVICCWPRPATRTHGSPRRHIARTRGPPGAKAPSSPRWAPRRRQAARDPSAPPSRPNCRTGDNRAQIGSTNAWRTSCRSSGRTSASPSWAPILRAREGPRRSSGCFVAAELTACACMRQAAARGVRLR